MDKLNSYDKIILDGFGTLYDKNYIPLKGANKLLKIIHEKSVLFSNVGSKTSTTLKNDISKKFDIVPTEILTSFDLLLLYISELKIKEIFHFGGEHAENELKNNGIVIDDRSQTIIFSSLPQSNWIQKSQLVLKKILHNQASKIILANPDRIIISKHIGINVGMMFDMLIKSWPSNVYENLELIEIGKPNISRKVFSINNSSKILVIGDNFITDGGLASSLKADFCFIGDNLKKSESDTKFFSFKTLEDLLDNQSD